MKDFLKFLQGEFSDTLLGGITFILLYVSFALISIFLALYVFTNPILLMTAIIVAFLYAYNSYRKSKK